MENTNQNLIDSIAPIVRQIHIISLKIQQLSEVEAENKDAALKPLSNVLKHYVDLLSASTGIELETK